ncbi:MAG: hypothetical protein J5645_08420 [Lachnospiraceae bacterium]|nr:hypothetical protein [Lachnospiraceae bacterium]
MKPHRVDGAVTVLMTVVFLLVMSLVLVGLESARQQGAVGMVNLAMQTSAESVLGEYYAPLFDEYGLYGLYDVDIKEELARYASAAADPTADVPNGYFGESKSNYSYAFEISDIALTRTVGLLQGGPSICRNQMIEAGAVSGVQELAELLLRAVRLLKDSEKSVEALEYQQRIERELSKTDAKILELMTLLDGIPTDKDGVRLKENGTFTPMAKFAKRAVSAPVTAQSVHMNNESFFRQMENAYVDIKTQINDVAAAISNAAGAEAPEAASRGHVTAYYAIADALKPTEEAIKVLDDLIRLQETYRPMVEEFEEYLETLKPLVEEDFYKSLEDGVKVMKKYIGEGKDGSEYHFREMRQTLERNRDILAQLKEKMKVMPVRMAEWKSLYMNLPGMAEGYSLDWMEIDYSQVKVSTQGSSLWKAVKDAITNGIVGGVYGEDIELSGATVRWETDKPSSYSMGTLESLYLLPSMSSEGSLSASFLSSVLEGNLFGELLDRLADGIVDLSEKLLLITYLTTHMTSYADEQRTGVLHYEQEYLLYGNNSDSQNQKSATKSILGLRAIMNVIHVFTDSAKRGEALAIAAELLALLPFPLLIKLTQYVILAVWAIQNAYLETAEILRGKAVPALVTASSFQLSLSEAFTQTKAKRIAAAQAYESPGGFCLSYSHYLMLLMLFTSSDTLTMRGLDIIQFNLRTKYDRHFLLKDCVYGFEATMTANCPAVFTGISFGNVLPERITSYEIKENCAVSY